MILTAFNYDTVKITYDEPVDGPGRARHNCREETWRGSQIFFKNDVDNDITTLEIRKGDKMLLLGRAKAIELTPWGAKFEAYWWASYPIKYNKDGRPSKRRKSGFKKLVRADIICEI